MSARHLHDWDISIIQSRELLGRNDLPEQQPCSGGAYGSSALDGTPQTLWIWLVSTLHEYGNPGLS
jgi:hypothetical protein